MRSRHVAGLIGAARALNKLGRRPEAEALLSEGRYRFPLEPGVAILAAVMAEEAGDYPEALKRWAGVRQRFPFDRVGYVDGMAFLRRQQKWAESEVVAVAAAERFPTQAWPLAEYAMLATLRGDWCKAAERWARLRHAFPEREDAYQREAEALSASGQSARADNVRAEHSVRFCRAVSGNTQ